MLLKHGKKLCFMGYCRFLPHDHKWRKCKWFDGKDSRPKPNRLSRYEVLDQLNIVEQPIFGKGPGQLKKRKRPTTHLHWTKKVFSFNYLIGRHLQLDTILM